MRTAMDWVSGPLMPCRWCDTQFPCFFFFQLVVLAFMVVARPAGLVEQAVWQLLLGWQSGEGRGQVLKCLSAICAGGCWKLVLHHA